MPVKTRRNSNVTYDGADGADDDNDSNFSDSSAAKEQPGESDGESNSGSESDGEGEGEGETQEARPQKTLEERRVEVSRESGRCHHFGGLRHMY